MGYSEYKIEIVLLETLNVYAKAYADGLYAVLPAIARICERLENLGYEIIATKRGYTLNKKGV